METVLQFGRQSASVLKPHALTFSKQFYWLFAFLYALVFEDVETLMQIVYDDRHILPKHARLFAGRVAIRIIRRYVERRYATFRILRDISARFKHTLYDIWLLLPELRSDVDNVRMAFAESRKNCGA